MFVKIKYPLISSFLIFWIFTGFPCVCPCSADSSQIWQSLETEHTIVTYQSDEDLVLFHKSVDYGPGEWNKNPLISDISISEIKKMLYWKVDAIFRRAQEILDMKKKFKKVNVLIYPDEKSLGQAYTDVYKGQCNLRAWYRYRTNSVYLNVQDVHAGMLAHELAHGIIDHFLLVKPPSNTAEILARYVDAHLE